MKDPTIALVVSGTFLVVASAAVMPVARRLGAKRHGYFHSFVSVLGLLLSAIFFAQSEPSSVAWIWSATLLTGAITFALVLGLSLFRGAVAIAPVAVVAILFAIIAMARHSAWA
jgi:predicted phage tail protein